MKHLQNYLMISIAALLFSSGSVEGVPTTAYDAGKVVEGWLITDSQPLGATVGQHVKSVETFTDEGGEAIYYVVYLEPSGFVIVPADNSVEPIIGFADDGIYEPSADNPVGALVIFDVKERVRAARETDGGETMQMGGAEGAANKWDRLTGLATSESSGPSVQGAGTISDVRIDPLVLSKWAQQTCGTSPPLACYNYYTPPYASGDPNNYPCGCVATAMSQVMRYHTHPVGPIAGTSFTITVDGGPVSATVRGGDGIGGPYSWGQMIYQPDGSTLLAERQAIGALCYDAGISVLMSYTAGMSTATLLTADAELVNQFDYDNSIYGVSVLPGLNAMINPNLDYSHPVIVSIAAPNPEHAIVVDGYGYNASTMYHHLNMGWAGVQDMWYHFCTDMPPGYTTVLECVYNIFVADGNEIISGLVTDTYGSALSGETVTATRNGGGIYQAVTNSRGIYAIGHVPSASTYTVSITKAGYSFNDRIVDTGTSSDGSPTAGNVWGVDFTPFGGAGANIYVDVNALGNNDGTSWADAYNYLQDALSVASSGDNILVAKGTYKPDESTASPSGSGSEAATFQLISGTAVYGGFPNGGSNSWDDRDITGDETILSGDIGTEGDAGDNSDHVVTSSGTDSSTILDGFTISGGDSSSSGSGILNDSGSPIIRNCQIINNTGSTGGGIYNRNSNATIENCLFSGNTGSYGGGMSNANNSTVTIKGCTFKENSAGVVGGGLEDKSSSLTAINCDFIRNTAGQSGGGIYNDTGGDLINCRFVGNSATDYYGGALRNQQVSGTVTNCIFVGNKQGNRGGGVWNYNSNIKYSNCVFANNIAGTNGGGMYNQSVNVSNADPCIVNCIFWGNEDSGGINETSQIHNDSKSDAIVSYSCIQDDVPDDANIPYGGAVNNNIDVEPVFEREPNDGGDGWGNGNDDYGDVHLSFDSPCVDIGGNSEVNPDTADIDTDGDVIEPVPLDLDMHSRFSDGNCDGTYIVDMGAYEFAWIYIGDLDGDCDVDMFDFGIFAGHWLAGT